MPKTKLLILSLAVALQITIPHFAAAASIDIPCRPSDTAQGKTQEQVKSENQVALFTCVNQLYKYALVICSIAAVFMIILGGYMYIFSGGSDKKVATAKSFISTSLLGIGVLLTGFLLLKQINPELLTIKNITPQQIGQRDWVKFGNGQITNGSADRRSGGSIGPTGKGQAGNVQGNGVTCNGGYDRHPTVHVNCGCFASELSKISDATIRALARAVLYQETQCGANNRTSTKGAKGPMQILDGTAGQYRCAANWATDNAANIACGAKILADLNAQYGGAGPQYVFAAYNAGPASLNSSSFCPGMQRWECAFDNAEHTVCNAGVDKYEQTRNYAVTASRFYNEARACGI